ncbi:MAG: hypothetical protein ACE14M_05620 [Terriglobales bacterium]
MKNRLILWVVLLLVGFLIGFIPQYSRAQRTQSEMASARQQLSQCQLSGQLSQLRDTAALMYVEASRKNYGLAGERAAQFFTQASQVAASTSDVRVRNALQQMLQVRDEITADLAKGDPAVVPKLQELVLKAQQDIRA